MRAKGSIYEVAGTVEAKQRHVENYSDRVARRADCARRHFLEAQAAGRSAQLAQRERRCGTTAHMQPVVLTQLGRLEGDEGPNGVQVFRGIPYAQAPIGELRFRAPQPLQAWTGTRSARAFGASAPQDRVMADVGLRDEDCLFLNVWTPAVGSGKRPVMVWIHGGSFNMGSGSQPMYDAANLALRGNLVVVTINYRLGALGFVHLRELLGGQADRADANNGLRDQVAALRWVGGGTTLQPLAAIRRTSRCSV